MSREAESSTAPPGGYYEPLRPPEPVPAPPLPDEPEQDEHDEYWPPRRTGDTDQQDWSDRDWYGPDSEPDQIPAGAGGRRAGWDEHARWADSLPERKSDQSWAAAQARLEQEWGRAASAEPEAAPASPSGSVQFSAPLQPPAPVPLPPLDRSPGPVRPSDPADDAAPPSVSDAAGSVSDTALPVSDAALPVLPLRSPSGTYPLVETDRPTDPAGDSAALMDPAGDAATSLETTGPVGSTGPVHGGPAAAVDGVAEVGAGTDARTGTELDGPARTGGAGEPEEPGRSGRRQSGASVGGFGGRHARRGAVPAPPVALPPPPRLDYIPRHAANGQDAVSPTDLTEILARVREDPTEAPRLDRPESRRRARQQAQAEASAEPVAETPAADAEPALPPGKRVRVVLSQRKGQARPVRTVVDVQELTQVGEVLSSSLIRSQLALALRIAAIALLGLGALPAMFYFVPRLAALQLFGLRLPWLLLGVAVYPFLLLLGWMYSRSAEKIEQIFADHIQS